MYKLTPSQHDNLLFFRLDGDAAERHGSIGYLRCDFGQDGRGFWTTWFDSQPHLKTPGFKKEFDSIINSLRDGGQEPPFASRRSLEAFCAATPGKELTQRGGGYMVRTQDYSYYFRCQPQIEDYDIYCHTYDNRWLLPELAGKHELPNDCFSVLPSTGELVFIVAGEKGYFQQGQSTSDPAINRQIATAKNALLGVTRGQEEAMLAGSMFGWNTPAARPWNYDQNGRPRPLPPKNRALER